MRIWLVDDRAPGDSGSLLQAVRQVVDQTGGQSRFLGAGPYRSDFQGAMRAVQPECVVIHEPAWPDGAALQDLAELDAALLIACRADRCGRFLGLAERRLLWFVPAQPEPETLALALTGLHACRRCEGSWKAQVAALQQRLQDRIVIERAKGILVTKLGVTEEEAYQRLRISSRRQRRQIRDIAQSLLDTQSLLTPPPNGQSQTSVSPPDTPPPP
jgi:hypothetical protein